MKTAQQWLKKNVADFIEAKNWSSNSPDLNPLDYELWSVLAAKMCQKSHSSLENLKHSFKKVMMEIPKEAMHTLIND